MKKVYEFAVSALVSILGSTAIFGVFAALVMWLWNAILPGLTGYEEMSYWQSVGLCIMFRLMTGHIGFSFNKPRPGKQIPKHEAFSRSWYVGGKSGFEFTIGGEEPND